MTAQLSGSCFLRRGRNWRTSTSTGQRWMSKKWHFCSATRIRILSIELSERGKGRHPPSCGQRSGNLKLDNKCKQERQEVMNKVWLVFGSASGLDLNIAEAVLESGDRLVATTART